MGVHKPDLRSSGRIGKTAAMSSYPALRMRRLRRHDWTRRPEHRAAERSEGVARATLKKNEAAAR